MEPIVIEYPHFPEEIQISEQRRAKYFIKGKDIDKYPQKYFGNDIIPQKGYLWREKKGRAMLWDERNKTFVVKNSLSAGKPRYVSIAGNDIMRMFEHTRNKIVSTLKEYFTDGLRQRFWDENPNVEIPINIRIEIHTFPHYMHWDLDNLWIYNK